MRTIFEEYGKVIIAVFVAIALLGIIFGGIHIYKVMGDTANVETVFNHTDSEKAIDYVSKRTAPTISVPADGLLHLYTNQVFKPLRTIKCWDAEGVELTAEVVSIVFIDNELNSKTELINYYDGNSNTLDLASLPEEFNKTGSIAVTFRAVDNYNIVAIRTISYVVDAS